MSVYSVHDDVNGGFVYYETPERLAVNDDQPFPSFPSGSNTDLGVSSLEAGRPLPSGSKQVGRGDVAKGRMSTGRPPGVLQSLRALPGTIDPSLGAFDASTVEDFGRKLEPAIPYLSATAGALVGARFGEGRSTSTRVLLTIAGSALMFYGVRKFL